MCYQVVAHTLRCDVRPLVGDGEKWFVDPFAASTPCKCMAEKPIKPWLRCDQHGCCMRIAKLYKCAKAATCGLKQQYHRYSQAPSGTRSNGRPWTPVPAADEYLLPRTAPPAAHAALCQSADFCAALQNVLTARDLLGANERLARAVADKLARARAGHQLRHGPCERVLNEWECDDLAEVARLEKLAECVDALSAQQAGLFRVATLLLAAVVDRETASVDAVFVPRSPGMVGWDDAESRAARGPVSAP